MAKYNLALNGYFDSLTTSGTGDIDLSWAQLESLTDGNLTSSGVTLTVSGSLWLQVDLSERIKVDGIRLYASDLTKSANINFYYKNSESDSYSGIATQVGASYYYTTISGASAPRYIRATISGVDIDVYEFQVFNDDYIVAFGADGSQSSEYLDNTPLGEIGTPEAISLFNNDTGSVPANAYAAINYTDKEGDWYVEISSSENGTYYSLNDGVVIEDNSLDSTYVWDMGTYADTTVSGNDVVLDGVVLLGTYVSPIVKMTNAEMSSYFIIDATTISGIHSVSYDAGSYNGTIRVKSNDTEPIGINEIYWFVDYSDYFYIYKYNLYDFDGGNWVTPSPARPTSYVRSMGTAIDRRTGYVAYSFSRITGGIGDFSESEIKIYDRDANELYSKYLYNSTDNVAYEVNGFDVNMEFDKVGGVWGYQEARVNRLLHFDYQLANTLANIYSSGDDFVYDLAVELEGDGVWYTDKINDVVYHLDSAGTGLHSISLTEPRSICGTNDNGCWVIDNSDYYARKYTSSGTLSKSVYLGRDADRMCADYEDGFWYISGTSVYHVNSIGTTLSTTVVGTVSRVKPALNGCLVWSEPNYFVKYINSAGIVVTTIAGPSSNTGFPCVFSQSYNDHLDLQTDFIPVSYDPVWGSTGSAQWKEVRKDGYFLAKDQYHQFELTLRTTTSGNSPSIDRVIMAPAVKVQDIQPQSSKNMYIRTNIPSSVDVGDYETSLNVWWGVDA